MKKKRRLLSPVHLPPSLCVMVAAVDRHIEVQERIWLFDASLLTPLISP